MPLNIIDSAEVMNFSRVNSYISKINSKLSCKEWVETQMHQKYYKITFDGCMNEEEMTIIRARMTNAGWTIMTFKVIERVVPDGIGSTHLTFM